MVSKIVTTARNNLIKAIAAAASLAVLGACASSAPLVQPTFIEMPRINKLTIVDLRPAKDLAGGELSRLIFECDFGVMAMSEVNYPDKAARLERDLYAAFGDGLVGHTIEIIKYRSFVNNSAQMTEFAANVSLGPVLGPAVGGVPSTLKPKCERAKMTGGWFDPADLKNTGRPWSLDATIRVDGKTYSATIATSPASDGTYGFSNLSFDYAADMVAADGKTTSLDQVLARELHKRLIEEMKKGGWSAQQDRI
jgi:hypothetical protein